MEKTQNFMMCPEYFIHLNKYYVEFLTRVKCFLKLFCILPNITRNRDEFCDSNKKAVYLHC